MLKCKDCPHWYGGEDYGYGSCRFKLKREEKKYLTFGQMDCDEGVKIDWNNWNGWWRYPGSCWVNRQRKLV